jgi:hypothetical protein
VTLPQTPTFKPHFRFESFWTLMPGFQETVSQAWNREVQPALNPSTTLHIKLSRTAKAPRSWSRSLIPQTKVASAVCREVIQQLESTQEQRQLNLEERQLISTLKNRLLKLQSRNAGQDKNPYSLGLKKGMRIPGTFSAWPMSGNRETSFMLCKFKEATIWQPQRTTNRKLSLTISRNT